MSVQSIENKPVVLRVDLEPVGGIAGDMFAAAMFSGFPYLYSEFRDDLSSLGIDGLTVTLEDRLTSGLQAKYFNVKQQTSEKPPRTLVDVQEFFDRESIDRIVAQHAVGIFTELAHAESEVHGKTLETIHFHEVSDWDSVVDIVAAAGIIARLNCAVWRVGVLPLGSGTVNTAHGDIPVPAPATLSLLKNFNWQDDGIGGERVTPTGAAILAYLKATPVGNVCAAASLTAVGSGCGSRELDGRANILRIAAFSDSINSSDLPKDEVMRIAFEVDDMTAEEIAWAADELRAAEGVLDVACLNLHGKKSRLSTGFRIIVSTDHLMSVVDQSFAVTSTIGIRYNNVSRFVLNRAEDVMENTSVKLAERPGGLVSAKASSDDLASAGSLFERRARSQADCGNALLSYRRKDIEGNK